MIEVNVTSTDFTVNVTDSVKNITVTADNSLFTVTSVVSNVTVTNVTPIITFETEGFDFDFAIKNRGEWVPNFDYTRNDVVRYENSIYICQIQFNIVLTSATPPDEDTNSWELFYWNQWPKQYLTITNWLDVGTDISAGGNLTVDGNAQISGTTRLDGTTTINGDAVINGRLQGISEFTANTGTFNRTLTVGANSTTNGTFFINGLRYPSNKGIYGQVLFTGGEETSQAAWVNLGELVFWSLSDDLFTNGFNIVTGINNQGIRPQLTIGNGVSGNLRANINFPAGGGSININTTQTSVSGRLAVSGLATIGGTLTVSNDANLNGDVNIGDTLRVGQTATFNNDVIISGDLGGPSNGIVRLQEGIRFPDGTFLTTAAIGTGTSIVPIATTATLGIIRVGRNLSIDADTGILNATTQTLTIPIATTSTLGGIRIGTGVQINSSTGVLSVPVATTSSLGIVQVGNGLLISPEGLLTTNINPGSLPIATTSTLGGVIVGNGLDITLDGVISVNSSTIVLPVATTSSLGVVQIGNGINVDNGVISITTATLGNISLTQDMRTNGFKIMHSAGSNDTYIDINSNTIELNLELATNNRSRINMASGNMVLQSINTGTSPATGSISLDSVFVQVGASPSRSELRVQNIYNQAGTSAPFFPAGVQYQDNTIQRTAWRGYDQGLI